MREGPPAAFTRRPTTEEERKIDPIRFCVATTVAAIAWLITPPLAVTLFALLGIRAYWKAYRNGMLRSRCILGDTRLVLVYLVVLAAAGATTTVVKLLG